MSLNMFKALNFLSKLFPQQLSRIPATPGKHSCANQTSHVPAALQTSWNMFHIDRSWTDPDWEATSMSSPTCGSCEDIQIKTPYSFSTTCCLLLSIVTVCRPFNEKSRDASAPPNMAAFSTGRDVGCQLQERHHESKEELLMPSKQVFVISYLAKFET